MQFYFYNKEQNLFRLRHLMYFMKKHIMHIAFTDKTMIKNPFSTIKYSHLLKKDIEVIQHPKQDFHYSTFYRIILFSRDKISKKTRVLKIAHSAFMPKQGRFDMFLYRIFG